MEETNRLTEDGVTNAQEPSVFVDDTSLYGKEIKAVPKPEKNIGIDTAGEFYDNLIDAGVSGTLNTTNLEAFTRVSDSRGQLYNMMDSMMSDPTISTGVEIYAENCVEPNSLGRVIWAESEDKNVASYVNHLLDMINVDKNAYQWMLSLIKYGDLYLRLYRNSEYNNSIFKKKENKALTEQVNIRAYSKDDKYSNYVEMVRDPATMFELTRFGKTEGYIEAVNTSPIYKDNIISNQSMMYRFNTGDVNIYEATEFVHACLDNDASRYVETVDITNEVYGQKYTYEVRKGKPMLYDLYRLWRQQTLLENSVIMNRVTRSSITRILKIDVGDMSKTQVDKRLHRIKSMVEQKTAVNTGAGMDDYTDPSPVENIIYLPVNGEKGGIEQIAIGGDVNVGELTDLEYFKDKYYGAFGIPKQYMGDTGDSAGFDAGASLAQISSKFAKKVKRIQMPFIQAIEEIINLMLVDRDLLGYIGKFALKMVSPATKEETDRQNNTVARIGLVNDVVGAVSNVIDDEDTRLEVLRTMMTNAIGETDVPAIIDNYIKRREEEQEEESAEEEQGTDGTTENPPPVSHFIPTTDREEPNDINSTITRQIGTDTSETNEIENRETILPTPAELNIDMTDNSEE